ncbi:alpha-rhamnosidase [Colletotrichum truncatum]|uniref:Alpha-rhamnosidase n=1 Tax=Colletotrichum truncatum TaxID=5467 RepID=A0ACC3Z719_COLTU
MGEPNVVDVRIEHYAPGRILGIHEQTPRISWRFIETPTDFQQEQYEIELTRYTDSGGVAEVTSTKVASAESHLVPWPAITSAFVSREKWSIRYQSYDITELLQSGANYLGIRVAEGWCTGRFGFGSRRAIWADRTALLAQLHINYSDGTKECVATDGSWEVLHGPIRLAELYDGESSPGRPHCQQSWSKVEVLSSLPADVVLKPGYGEPARHIERVLPKKKITTPSGKVVLDFGQNLVGVVQINDIRGQAGDCIALTHAEVLEHGELGLRPLRACKARDMYTLRGDEAGETYRPRFTFHGFRYVQVDGWPSASDDVLSSVEALVVHTDMQPTGDFSCSDSDINQLFSNVRWSMKGNFLSVPTDCPQRDERLGWTGDAALFTPTPTRLYKCFGILRNWMEDVRIDQSLRGGIPPLDWLDPTAPADQPQKAVTDPILVADAFLINSLDLVLQTARILNRGEDVECLEKETQAARKQFTAEYITSNGRLISDSQTAYALAICFNLLSPALFKHAGDRLVEIVRQSQFKIGTGFAGTPFICEALVLTGHANIAFAMLLNKQCPSWLYPVNMGATTIWERWDSMLPDGSINEGEMTSFNHYALGAIATFLMKRLAGLAPAEPGWRSSVARPVIGGGFRHAKTEHTTPYGTASCSWELVSDATAVGGQMLKVNVQVPPTTEMEVILPGAEQGKSVKVGAGTWSFSVDYQESQEWPVEPMSYPF